MTEPKGPRAEPPEPAPSPERVDAVMQLMSRGALSECPACRKTSSWSLRHEPGLLGVPLAIVATCGNCGFMSAHDPRFTAVRRRKPEP